MSSIPHDKQKIQKFAQSYVNDKGWGFISCDPYKEGASNSIWSLETQSCHYVLKVGKLDYWRRLSVEAGVLEYLAGVDVPRILSFGEANKEFPWDWAVLEFVKGRHPFSLNSDQAFELGRLLQRIRSKTSGIHYEEGSWRYYFENRIEGAVKLASPKAPEPIRELFEKYLDRVERCAKYGDILDREKKGISHGDITPYNLILKPDGQFCLIDWEYPRSAGMVWDLACIRKAFRLEPQEFRALCEGTGEAFSEETLIFADILYQLQVSSWRAEMLYGRGKQDYGDFFITEMGEELGRVEVLLRELL